MNIKIYKQKLKESEVDLLIEEIRKFPNPLTGKKTFMVLPMAHVLYLDNELAGVCGVTALKNFIKLGPFVVFQRFHKQGFGRKIFESVLSDYPNRNLYVGSRSPAVVKLALHFGFVEEKNVFKIPLEIHKYFLSNMLENLNLYFIKEFFRKHPVSEGPFRFFFRKPV